MSSCNHEKVRAETKTTPTPTNIGAICETFSATKEEDPEKGPTATEGCWWWCGSAAAILPNINIIDPPLPEAISYGRVHVLVVGERVDGRRW
jgi:hypothetical protein